MTTTAVAPLPATTGPAPAVMVRGLVKRYAGRAVLDGLDLEVRRGECFALLSPNGAGKTTTIEVLEGVRSRDGGEVTVLGEDPARTGRDWRARLGVVSKGEPAGQVRTEAPAAVLRDLLAATPHEVPGLTVTRPGLEDVYFQLVGAVPPGHRRARAGPDRGPQPHPVPAR